MGSVYFIVLAVAVLLVATLAMGASTILLLPLVIVGLIVLATAPMLRAVAGRTGAMSARHHVPRTDETAYQPVDDPAQRRG